MGTSNVNEIWRPDIGAIDDLEAHLRAHASAPLLFVGSGMSRRYLKLPDWEGLLRQLASLTERPYGYFVTAGDGRPPAIATAIAEALREKWWADRKFEESRSEFGDSLGTREGPLKVEAAKLTRESLSNLPTEGDLAKEIEALKKSVVDAVITTNYDQLLETVFEDFRPYIGQDELLFSDPQGVGEIYKIHGDEAFPESMVLTEGDFGQFEERNPYLAAKLLTLFVEHPVIFLGYSLQDPDITSILVSFARVLTKENLQRLEGNLILVEWDADQRTPQITRGIVSSEGFSVPVKILRLASFIELFEMLGRLEHKFSAAVLRRLKHRVYELVRSNQPLDRLYVDNIENAPSQDFDVVIGVGMEARLSDQGYLGIQRRDLLLDVLNEHSAYNARRIVGGTLPALLRQTGLTPIYRYLREDGLLDANAELIPGTDVDAKIVNKVSLGDEPFHVPLSTAARARRIATESGNTLKGLIESQSCSVTLATAPVLPTDGFTLEELRRYLVETSEVFDRDITDRANWTRLVGRYDYLRFGLLGK
ncbi:SIR2 family protein [Psychromicrobium xiongbiense]|uniref:SIR2 family protein n=1 Tax=Psychromicrobium xiongbiense TaxID=3051184 RepID=UPI0025575645|nr:SIR2 family protein [Psychromicrobium sp. YIM S02556]